MSLSYKMNTIQQAIIQSLIKLLTPTSPAYGNTLAFERPQTCEELKQKLQPGDVIFSRTNSFLYEVSRRFMGMKYDHVAVIINSKEVIHISPPIISKIDMEYIMNPSREPLIIRPKVEDKEKFLTVIHNFLGEKYNLASLPKFAVNQIKRRFNISTSNQYSFANLKYSRVCSDTILYSLCRGSEKIKSLTDEQAQKGRYKEIGCFLPDQVAQILLANDSEIILKSKFSKEYKFIDAISKTEEGTMSLIRNLKHMIKTKLTKQKQSTDQRIDNQPNNSKDSERKSEKMLAVQMFSLILALAQILGASINNKVQYLMIILNTVMMIGHIGQIKNIMEGHLNPKL